MDNDIGGAESSRVRAAGAQVIQRERERRQPAHGAGHLRGCQHVQQGAHIQSGQVDAGVVDEVGDVVEHEHARQSEPERQAGDQGNGQAAERESTVGGGHEASCGRRRGPYRDRKNEKRLAALFAVDWQ